MNRSIRRRRTISPRLRFQILKRDHFMCQYCGGRAPEVELEVDHVLPVSRGGTNDPRNLTTSCDACNAGKLADLLDDDARTRLDLELPELLLEILDHAERDPGVVPALRMACLSSRSFSRWRERLWMLLGALDYAKDESLLLNDLRS